ncbi:MAG: sugar transferase, partial [Patescibacteria group bacterium]
RPVMRGHRRFREQLRERDLRGGHVDQGRLRVFDPHTIEETKEILAYDLYYLKNRSLALDIKIALKTIRTILSRTGV